jgi:two-component sensor histidine kinase
MTRAIKLLQVEDSEDDAALIVHMLEKAGYAVDAERVETEEQLRRALATGACDLVIADYRLPQFSAPEALKVFQETHLDVPFIVVSGVMGSETAISMMKAGAHDFLLKERLERLTPAVERELNEAAIRREKREADDKLRAAYAELEAIYANAPVLMFVTDAELQVRKINDLAARFCGKSTQDCLDDTLCGLLRCIHAGARFRLAAPETPCVSCNLSMATADALRDGSARRDSFELSSPLTWGEGTWGEQARESCLLTSVAPMAAGETQRLLVCAQDVTRLKRAEFSLQETIDSLRQALAQNVVLFQEVHHRVKNNLQIVASLLSMKARKSREQIGAEDLKDCELRIRSMAMIHEQLYSQKDMSVLDFAGYVKRIVPELIASYERGGSVTLRLEVSPTILSIDQSIPCGLILNELITNAIKYAYPDGKGEILVQLGSDAETVRMTVADQGRGMPPGAADGTGTSLGMQIVRMLTRQLRGSLEFGVALGTTVCLSFPRGDRASD